MDLRIVDETVDDYIVSVSRPDGVTVRILVPKCGSGWPDECAKAANGKVFGLNLLTEGHYS